MYAHGLAGIGDNVSEAIAYLRSKWEDFLRLSPRIIDLQHRAAVTAAEARERGDLETYKQARARVEDLAELQRKHDTAVRTMETVRDYVGLSGYRGLGAIPFAQVAVITGLALTVVWFFRAFDAQAEMLDAIERGDLTPEQAVAISQGVGAAPGQILGGVANVAKYAAFAALAYLGLQALAAWQSTRPRPRARRNPPLVVFDRNPPGDDGPSVFGSQVYGVWYRHADDGGDWFHEFGPGVEMIAEPDGSVAISHRGGRRVWEEF